MKKLLAASTILTLVLMILMIAAPIAVAQNAEPAPEPEIREMWTLEAVAFIAVFLGVIGRLLFPYFKKIREAKAASPSTEIKFDYTFAVTATEAFIEGFIVVSQIFAPFLATVPVGVSMFMLFLFGFNYGWGRTDLNNRLIT